MALVPASIVGDHLRAILERLPDLLDRGSRLQLERRLERVEAEEVAMRAVARRRARPPVTRGPEIVSALDRRSLVLPEAARGGVDSPGGPVGEGPGGRVRGVEDPGERLPPLGQVGPLEGRRDVLALARGALGDLPAVVEGRAG